MAKKKAVAVDVVAKHVQELDSYLEKLRTEPNAISIAYGFWITYPLQREMRVDSPKLEKPADENGLSQLHNLEYKLDEVHQESTRVLMIAAERAGIDSSTILQSANYCRELLARAPQLHYAADRPGDFWPECLGKSVYDLPLDVRQAIQDGCAQLKRLGIKLHLPDDPAEALRIMPFDHNPTLFKRESKRGQSKPRSDEPTSTDVANVRKVMDGMSARNPSVEQIRRAVKTAGFRLSNAKTSAAIKKIRG